MKRKIKLSVIFPCYNVDKYLDQLFLCLDDVDLDSIEFIFVNDGSTDLTKDKLTDYVKKNKKCMLINQKNGGVSSARNNGLKHASGEYISFIDSDDLIKPDSFRLIIDAIYKENADVLTIKSTYVKSNFKYNRQKLNKLVYKVYTNKDLNYIFTQGVAMKDIYLSVVHMFFKKSIIESIDGYPNIFKNIFGEDGQFSLTVLEKCKKILVSKNIFYFYRQNRGSLMHSKFNEKIITWMSCNDQLFNGKYNNDVVNHALARNYLNSICILQKMIKCKYDNKENIKYVYSIFKNNRKYLIKANQINWAIRLFTPLCTPYFYLSLRTKLK